MKIVIESIPHANQRYPTCGDWYYDAEGILNVRVSSELPTKSQQLVVLHELAEVFMCQAAGVTQKMVDEFDMNFEANRQPGDDAEPGDSPDAPYRVQHLIATGIEIIAAAQMGVNWPIHDAVIADL